MSGPDPMAKRRHSPVAEADEDPSDVDALTQDSLGLQLRLALRGMRQAFRGRLARDGIPWSTWYALRALWKEEGLTQGELAQRVGALQPNVATAIRQMQQLGLVVVEREPSDRRKLRIFLTGRAKALKTTLLPDVEALNELALADFTVAERRTLSRLLAKLHRNIERRIEDAAAIEEADAGGQSAGRH